MRQRDRSLVCEEIAEQETDLAVFLQMRHLFTGNASADPQPVSQVVKVSGNITVSF